MCPHNTAGVSCQSHPDQLLTIYRSLAAACHLLAQPPNWAQSMLACMLKMSHAAGIMWSSRLGIPAHGRRYMTGC